MAANWDSFRIQQVHGEEGFQWLLAVMAMKLVKPSWTGVTAEQKPGLMCVPKPLESTRLAKALDSSLGMPSLSPATFSSLKSNSVLCRWSCVPSVVSLSGALSPTFSALFLKYLPFADMKLPRYEELQQKPIWMSFCRVGWGGQGTTKSPFFLALAQRFFNTRGRPPPLSNFCVSAFLLPDPFFSF